MKRKILLVDDDASLLAMLGDFLESEGYEVTKAESGEKALVTLRSETPDLIVLDMSMPGIGGIGVLDRISLPDGRFRYPVLVLTARAKMAEYFADKQVDGFIAKPCDPEDLALEVSRIIFQTAGLPDANHFGAKPDVFLVDPNHSRRASIASVLAAAGYDVDTFESAAGLLEAAVQRAPAFVVMAMKLADQSAVVASDLLRAMATTSNIGQLVFGAGAPGVSLMEITQLREKECAVVEGEAPGAIVEALAHLAKVRNSSSMR